MTDCAACKTPTASSMVRLVDGRARAGWRAAASPARSPVPNAPKSTFANERFIALLIIMERMKPDVPSSAPAMMSTLLPKREAGRARGEARVRVEERDDDRHVRAADGEHREDAHRRSRARTSRRRRWRASDPRRTMSQKNERAEEQRDVHRVLALEGDRRAGDEALELAERHDASGERQEAEEHLEPERRDGDRVHGPRRGGTYSVTPTSAAARPPNACESAIRSGIFVIGIQMDMAVPMSDPMRSAGDDPLVGDDLLAEAACRRRRRPCRRRR